MMDLEAAINLLLAREYTAKELKGDTLLAERVKVARQYATASARFAVVQRLAHAAQAVTGGRDNEAFFECWIDELKTEVVQLGDRILQLCASPTSPGTVN